MKPFFASTKSTTWHTKLDPKIILIWLYKYILIYILLKNFPFEVLNRHVASDFGFFCNHNFGTALELLSELKLYFLSEGKFGVHFKKYI